VLIDSEVTLSDSSVICEYLNERYPLPSLLPDNATSRALSRWYEEFADSRLGEVLIWHFYNQLIIRRFVWGEAPDERILGKALKEEIPSVLAYLENRLPPSGFLFGRLCVADVSLASFFRNASFAKYEIDGARWPRTRAYVALVLGQQAFQQLMPFEDLCLRTPISKHHAVLLEAGAPICRETFGSSEPRRGFCFDHAEAAT
jgi:glutathione S-transferase